MLEPTRIIIIILYIILISNIFTISGFVIQKSQTPNIVAVQLLIALSGICALGCIFAIQYENNNKTRTDRILSVICTFATFGFLLTALAMSRTTINSNVQIFNFINIALLFAVTLLVNLYL